MFSWVYTWLNFENSNYSSQSTTQWFQVAKNPPKIISLVEISRIFPWKFQNIHTISIYGHCISFILFIEILGYNFWNRIFGGFLKFGPTVWRAIPAPRLKLKRHYNYYLELARVLWVTNKVSLPVFKEVNNYTLLSFLSLPPHWKGWLNETLLGPLWKNWS